MTPSSLSLEFVSAVFSCVAWLLALPLGIAVTAGLAVVQNNALSNAGSPHI